MNPTYNIGWRCCITVLMVASLSSCADEPGGIEVGSSTASIAGAPSQIVEPDGLTWIRKGRLVTTREPKRTLAWARPPATVRSVSDMSIDELVRDLSPVMRAWGYEYELIDQDKHALARDMKNRVGSGVSDGEASVSTPPEDGEDPGAANKIWFGTTDDRVRVNSYAHTYPYNMIASMRDGVGPYTGFKLLNEHTMVTAAHGIYNTNVNSWYPAPDIQFAAGSGNTDFSGTGNPRAVIPGVPSGVPDGNECYRTFIPTAYVNAADENSAWEHDYAVIRLRGAGATCDVNAYNVGWFGYRTRENAPASEYSSLRAVGYPGTPPSPVTFPSLYRSLDASATKPTTNIFPTTAIEWTEGQSGGPIYKNSSVQAYGLISHHDSSTNYGTGFNAAIISFFQAQQGS